MGSAALSSKLPPGTSIGPPTGGAGGGTEALGSRAMVDSGRRTRKVV
jgi:hypothetical protein